MTIGSDLGVSLAVPASVRQLVERRAAETPAAIYALAPEADFALTFDGLLQSCRSLARLLADRGVGPGDRVALLMPNGLNAVALFLGAMAAGCVVTPLSLLAKPAQLAYVLDHSDCRLVLVASELLDSLRAALALMDRPVEHLVVPEQGFANRDGDWPWPDPAGEDDALLMYTSGTTGKPKGVRLSHGNVLAGARNVSQAHDLGPVDRVLAVLPLYHINAQVVTILAPLWHGGSLVMPARFSASRFWQQAAEHNCTWLNVVPTIVAYLLDGHGPATPLAIRFCRSASAPLPPDQQRTFEARFGIGIIETMGLTETAAPVFTNPLDPAGRKLGSPGRPYGNQARVVDPTSGLSLPTGAAGEIHIRGPNVMQGYHKDPDATAAVLDADGWLKTGDLGFCDEDGFYFITGRLKELIIKGGENIAPREIDEALLKHPALLEAAAVGIPDPVYGQEIEAAVVVKPGQSVSEAELRQFCERELGRFKTPRAFHIVVELPKGPSGKVQRLRLLEGRALHDEKRRGL